MIKKTPITIILCIFMISSISASATNIDSNENNIPRINQKLGGENIPLPVWKQGDSWTYNIEVEGGYTSDIDFDLSIEGLTLKVIQVQNDKYKMDVDVPNDGITGSASVNIADILTLNGNLINTKLDGTVYIDKSTIGIIENMDDGDPAHQVSVYGTVDRPIIDVDFNVDMDLFFHSLFSCLNFPLSVGDSWEVEQTAIQGEYDITVAGLIDKEDQLLYFYFPSVDDGNVNYNCVKKETRNGYSDAMKITGSLGSENNIWYSEEAGGIVEVYNKDIKLYVYETNNENVYYDINKLTMVLKDTTYEPPNEIPDKPNKPTGPSSGRAGPSYNFCTSGGDDPDGHKVQYGFDWNGDGNIDSWTDLVNSGAQACLDHSFSSGDTYHIKAKTKDEKGGLSDDWSAELTVNIVPNNPPNKPNKPSGTTDGIVGNSYTYTTNTVTDPDGDSVLYQFDWGDGDKSQWKQSPSASYAWSSRGSFNVKTRSKDQYGATSDWTDSLSVTMVNTRPEIPNPPEGPSSVCEDKQVTYTATTTDPEGHQIYYKFDWGDGTTSNWEGPFASGSTGSASHTWSSKGSYSIKVKAKDEYNEETDWSDPIPIQVSRTHSRIINNHIFTDLFKDFLKIRGIVLTIVQQLTKL